jgi:NTE family protein/lysophospholipid hydrolase
MQPESDAARPGADLLDHLASTDLFATIDREALSTISGTLTQVFVPAGAALFSEGDLSDALYIARSGTFDVVSRRSDGSEIVLGRIGPGESIGGISVLAGGPRTATVRASSDAQLVKMPKQAFDTLQAKVPGVVAKLAAVMRQQLRRNQLVAALPGLFGSLDERARREIEEELEWVQLRAGETLFRQGDAGDSLYVVVVGRLRVTMTDGNGQERVLGEVIRGESVGEMGIVSGEERAATVHAIRRTTLVKLSRQAFDRVLERYPHAMMDLTRTVIRRWRQAVRPAPELEAVNVVVFPAGAQVPLGEFVRRLAETLQAQGPAMLLSSDRVDAALGVPGISQRSEHDVDHDARLASWLEERELQHRFVIYQADATSSPWTERCFHRAEHILIVGQAGADPEPGEVETALIQRLATRQARQTLVLLHRDDAERPTQTRAWLAPRHVEQHHHVRLSHTADLERLARFIGGRPTGLVLGGGGARGFAHIGVLRALAEVGIPIDIVGGTSMGSFIAAAHALGLDHDTTIRVSKDMFRSKTYDFTFPLVSLLAARKAGNTLVRHFGDVEIEDLWTPYFSVSSNLTRAEIKLHRTGQLWRSIRASGSLPGLVPPICDGADLLVDGALLDNVPVDVMREFCDRGTVIAIDVSPEVDLVHTASYEGSLSGWRLLRDRFNPFRERPNIPGIATVLARSVELAGVLQQRRATAQARADLYLRPPVEEFGLLEFKYVDKVVDKAYRFARPKIEEWLAARR